MLPAPPDAAWLEAGGDPIEVAACVDSHTAASAPEVFDPSADVSPLAASIAFGAALALYRSELLEVDLKELFTAMSGFNERTATMTYRAHDLDEERTHLRLRLAGLRGYFDARERRRGLLREDNEATK